MRWIVGGMIGAACLLGAAGTASAAENCAELDTTQTGLNQCYGRQAEAADGALNAVYRDLQKRLGSEAEKSKLLVATQRAWIAFRDAECAFQASAVEGGSAQPMVASQCLADLTKARTAQLKAYATCEEGDLACPVPPAP